MNTDEQRQILYAALLRHSPEAGSLRERALDRFVLVALLGSSRSEPMTIHQIQEFTVLAPKSPGLRTDVIDETLVRLVRAGRVDHVEVSAGDSYFLTELGRQHTDEATHSAAQLFRPVLDRMLCDTTGLFSVHDGENVCRTFISECFARFGHQIAKAVAGDFSDDESFGGADIEGAFQAAVQSVSLSEEAVQTLRVRCNRFLHSMEPDDKDLKFRLAQSYYVVQLLELSSKDFNLLADDAFREAVFYLDTNVVLDGLMSDDSASRFSELVTASSTLGIELRVTRATLDEATHVAMRDIEDIEKVVDTVPEKLLERTKDQFLLAYRDAKAKDPEMTPAKFMVRFQELPAFFRKLNITFENKNANEIVDGKDVSRECQIVNNAAEITRGWGKSDEVSLHDVCHFLLVQEERRGNPKAWFLTKDRTLSNAAVKLAPDELPFCFPLTAFLQSVSPFLETSAVRNTLVDVFSAVLDGEVGDLTGRSLFDMTELRLISEFHADVLSVPTEQLLPAFDYVKSNLLNGKPYRRDDSTKVALELRKFLTSSARKKEEALLAEIERQKALTATERHRRTDDANRMRKEIARLNEKIQVADGRETARARSHGFLSVGLAILGFIVASVCWQFDSELGQWVMSFLSVDGVGTVPFSIAVRVFGAAVFVGSLIPALSFMLKGKYRIPGYTIVVATAIGASDVVGLSMVKAISAYLAVATPIGLVIALALGIPKDKQ